MTTLIGHITGFVGALALSAYFGYQLFVGPMQREELHGAYFVADRSPLLLWVGLALLALSAGVSLLEYMNKK